jgi:hypothetical protein
MLYSKKGLCPVKNAVSGQMSGGNYTENQVVASHPRGGKKQLIGEISDL